MDATIPRKLDRPALEAMLSELRPRLHRYCARMAGSVIDGEDIVQDTLVKALQAVDGSMTVERPEQWLFRIAHNAAQDHLRRRHRERSRITEADMTTIEDPSGSADSRIAAAAGLRSFMQLSVARRGAVILVDVLGLSLHETCEVTGATLAATKATLHRGRAQLRLLAAEPEQVAAPRLDADDERRLRRYVDLFNARDFDAVRALIAEDIQLEVVNRLRLRGKAEVSTYFGNYDRVTDWALSLGFVDGRPAILIRNPGEPDGAVRGFMLVEWRDEQVVQIRDFRYASWCLVDAEISAVEG
ncbi:sigma-70 family RNA polymerase sigma factor [Mesorhizobium mediterraneum]|uniref:RNA polymerase subunit sigma-70 n=1 Tax=Mesorhizobium mediterraneum TaxID=43617 RepID=A0AB36RH71_9HYPH|nr:MULTISPECIES: sigma-70 family RNA polymerase sigma factor [Mesorhizobium]PAQ04228.1 RNA polymerase subunit sigma-70 [Mesorhizobium mediterraneum]RUU45533.1 sigma-70 family RNA polymerase sigma factor [Mesorhizobium sp. M6A.T.Ce.TU.002.03.1.1]RUV05167.1 sigma-70 family RNA polymerase sigma factor [Mesorhizobium sp. M6A.T.Cr.TU.017.01.1.1]RWN39424.1 MAG: sigma-70 family RNA polymerase sigma factor [Mesorhizobium sp.]RWP72187.1 MAG: sigma-70 family RNA polymerase sigma factor [Mesorhizobium sp